MARARLLKPGFFKNEVLAELNPHARLLFAGLWTLADREGRLEDRPKRIKADIFPYEEIDIELLLASLHSTGFIFRYSVNGARFIQLPSWEKHQSPHVKEPASTIPAPDKPDACTSPAPDLHSSGPSEALTGVGVGNGVGVLNRKQKQTQNAVCENKNQLGETWLGVFIAAGVALSEQDKIRAFMGNGHTQGFYSFDEPTQERIVAYTLEKAKSTEARYMGLPINMLDKREWERRSIQRVLPEVPRGKAAAGQQAAAASFMGAKSHES